MTDKLAALSDSVAAASAHARCVVPLHASSSPPVLPHHKLIAYSVGKELLLAVLRCSIRDAKLRDEAVRSAKSACLNTAEGAGRVTRADEARAFAIARAEAVEAAAAVEIAALCGDTTAARADEVARVASRLVALLTGLVR
jgi:four helix bundle protein